MRSSLLCRQPGKEGRGRNCFHLILYNKEKVDHEDMSKMYNNSQIEMVATWRGQDVSKPHQHLGTEMTARQPHGEATDITGQASRRFPSSQKRRRSKQQQGRRPEGQRVGDAAELKLLQVPRGTEKNEQSQIKEKEEKADKTKQT